MRQLTQSTIYSNLTFKAFLSSDHITPATGKTIAITISKNGGAFANPSAGATNASEIGSGWYNVNLSATDTNTLGDLIVRGTEASIDPAEQICQVNSWITSIGTILTAVDTEVAAIKAKTDQMVFTVANRVDASGGMALTDEVETGWTVQDILKISLAVLAGPSSGMNTGTPIFTNPAGTKNRVQVTSDGLGNRSSPTYDKT